MLNLWYVCGMDGLQEGTAYSIFSDLFWLVRIRQRIIMNERVMIKTDHEVA